MTDSGEHPLADRSDADLLAAHVQGHPTAFGILVARHQDRLWAVALRTLGNPDDAADALQDACIAAFRRASSFRGEAKVTTWLHRIVVNACLDRLRHEKSRAVHPLPVAVDLRPDAEYVQGAATHGTESSDDLLEAKERRLTVLEALAQLNADQRAALVLVDMEGYSVDEAAALLGCAPGTIKSRCARGRAKLLPLLAHLQQDAPVADR